MKNYLSILIAFLLFATTSCLQDDLIGEPNLEEPTLKSVTIGPGEHDDGFLASGAEWYIALPATWGATEQKTMIFYAHGLQDPGEGAHLPYDELIAGRTVEELVTEMGYAYATTSYRADGFVANEAVDDILELRAKAFEVVPDLTEEDILILGGPSEGGLVTALTLERHPNLFDGGLSICGPIGDFYRQIQYNGDFHVLFNYFFGQDLAAVPPGYSTGSPEEVGAEIMAQWSISPHPLQQAIQHVLTQDILTNDCKKLDQLLKCARVTVDMEDPVAKVIVAMQCLRYNIMITDDMIHNHLKHKVPFYNKYKWYSGSYNDLKLNREVERIYVNSYRSGKNAVRKYETTGKLQNPFVTIHTTGDHVTPFWHNPIYRMKALFNGSSLLHSGIPVDNYGHCTIEQEHVVAGLAILFFKIGLLEIFTVHQEVFANQESLENFKAIMQENSVDFEIKN